MDTLAHELTHYVITRASHNTVPIWLHEGIAKVEERRWREPFGGALPLPLEHVLASGLKANHLITFAQMHPSMALLPSQEDAALAYAEVATAIQFLTEDRGVRGLRNLLAQLGEHGDLSRAIASVTGLSFGKFEQKWRGWLKGRGYKTHPELGMQRLVFRTAEKKEHDDDEPIAHAGERSPTEAKAMGHVRLGTMLRTRGRLSAAAIEYERASALLGPGHPEVAAKLGRTYLELKQWDHAIAAAKPGLLRRPESAGLHVTVGKALLEKGDAAGAQSFLEGALAVNPFDPATRCGLRRVYESLHDARSGREAAACETLGGAP
jgi:tetratricopeptide (TPR) repeat protein